MPCRANHFICLALLIMSLTCVLSLTHMMVCLVDYMCMQYYYETVLAYSNTPFCGLTIASAGMSSDVINIIHSLYRKRHARDPGRIIQHSPHRRQCIQQHRRHIYHIDLMGGTEK